METGQKFRLDGKVAIVTGSSKGIGKAIAIALGEQGAKVVISSRKQEAVDETVKELKANGIEAFGMTAHMGDMEQVKNLANETLKQLGRIDILVNNAGIQQWMAVSDSDFFQRAKEEISINIEAPVHLAYLFQNLQSLDTIMNVTSGLSSDTGCSVVSVKDSSVW